MGLVSAGTNATVKVAGYAAWAAQKLAVAGMRLTYEIVVDVFFNEVEERTLKSLEKQKAPRAKRLMIQKYIRARRAMALTQRENIG